MRGIKTCLLGLQDILLDDKLDDKNICKNDFQLKTIINLLYLIYCFQIA